MVVEQEGRTACLVICQRPLESRNLQVKGFPDPSTHKAKHTNGNC